MRSPIKLRKGLDIKLKGKAEKILLPEVAVTRFGVRFADFEGLTAKPVVKEGDTVRAGTTIFYDKSFPEIKYASPVSGIVKEVVRGEKRLLMEVVIEQEGNEKEFFGPVADPLTLTREQVKERMLESGCDAYVSKPIDTRELPVIVAKFIEKGR